MRFFSKGLFLPKITNNVYEIDYFIIEMVIFNAYLMDFLSKRHQKR